MDITLSVADTVLRLGVAAVLGGLVGLERERLERAAGLRTHAVVAVASALIMIVSAYGFSDVLVEGNPIVLDPSRIAAQVVSGIGFLGAGVIIFRKNAVRGLTTAASVWSVAGIGLACGGGLLTTAVIATAFILIVQAGLRPVERKFFDHHYPQLVTMRLRRADGNLASVEAAIKRSGLHLRGLRLRPARGGSEDRVELEFSSLPPERASGLLDALRGIDGVRLVTYTYGPPRALNGDANADSGSDDDDSTDS
ncbi:MAG: MgtC/SapB family protein [Rhizobiales bacterium]|nr:MgtC/SapB family protein [Hyphomicrobiales bacterium]